MHSGFHVARIERKRIRDENCSSCIHDYHAPPTVEAQASRYGLEGRFEVYPFTSSTAGVARFARRRRRQQKQIVITGWYGTETVGDKAILAQIMERYRAEYGPDVALTISSIHPFVTRRTLYELGMSADVVPAYS